MKKITNFLDSIEGTPEGETLKGMFIVLFVVVFILLWVALG